MSTETLEAAADVEASDTEKRQAADLSALLMRMPAFRWLKVQRRYDMSTEEVLGNLVVMAIVANNEMHRNAGGKDDFDRFELMGLGELMEALGIGGDDDDSKSDDE